MAEELGRGIQGLGQRKPNQMSGATFESLWLARAAILAIIILQVFLSSRLTIGGKGFAPALEFVFLIVLFFMSHERRLHSHRTTRITAIILIGVINASNLVSLVLLVQSMLHGSKASGTTLLLDALNIWFTNMIIFALWYWEFDQGGPHERGLPGCDLPDFVFTQMTSPEFARSGWQPGFMDYLFLSFTNATAFSPTDTLPLSSWAKGLMMVQSSISLLTVALVASRAVNIFN